MSAGYVPPMPTYNFTFVSVFKIMIRKFSLSIWKFYKIERWSSAEKLYISGCGRDIQKRSIVLYTTIFFASNGIENAMFLFVS